MIMAPRLRKFALTTHVTVSVGWIGAVAVSLALGITAMSSRDTQTVRAVSLTLETIGWYVLVPVSFASLATGLIQSLGSKWGLFQHYWVLATLLLNVFATAVLLLYMQTLASVASTAAKTTLTSGDLRILSSPSSVIHASAALVLLLVATGLSIYKPPGMTKYGQRKRARV